MDEKKELNNQLSDFTALYGRLQVDECVEFWVMSNEKHALQDDLRNFKATHDRLQADRCVQFWAHTEDARKARRRYKACQEALVERTTQLQDVLTVFKEIIRPQLAASQLRITQLEEEVSQSQLELTAADAERDQL